MAASRFPALLRHTLLATLVALLPAPLLAQDASGGNLAEIIMVTPRAGHGHDLREGTKRHMALLAEQNDPSAWFVWEVMTGDNTGSIMVGTMGHQWADFDRMPDDPGAMELSFARNIEPHVADAQAAFWMLREDLSSMMPTPGEAPTRFAQIFHYMVRPDAVPAIEAGFTGVKEAAEAAGWQGGDWMVYQLVNGGMGPHYVVVVPGDSFADFAEPDPTMYEMLVGQMGEEGAMELFQSFAGATAAQSSEMIAFREDLSYMPDGGM